MKRNAAIITAIIILTTGCAKNETDSPDISFATPSQTYSDINASISEAVTEESSDSEADNETDIQEIIAITTDCVERMSKADDFLDRTPEARDENGNLIIIEPEEGDWRSWVEVETDHSSLDDIRSEFESCFTGDCLQGYIASLEYSFKEEDGKIYSLLAENAIGANDYYIDTTLEVEEQTEDSLTVSFDGFDTGYEQQLFCTAALRLIDGVWKIESFSTHG